MCQQCSGERVTGSTARHSNPNLQRWCKQGNISTYTAVGVRLYDDSDTADQLDVRRFRRNQDSQTQTTSLRAGKRVKGETIQVSIKILSS